MTREFKPGDRVQIDPVFADEFKQPWPKRIKRGLFGTVQEPKMHLPIVVQLDMPKRAKWKHDWFWTNVSPSQLLHVDQEAGE